MLIPHEFDGQIYGTYLSEEHRRFIQMRWMARTDLQWLCNNVLNYPDIQDRTHGPLIAIMQKFEAPPYAEWLKYDSVIPNQTQYTNKHFYRPYIPMYNVTDPKTEKVTKLGLKGKKRRLILDSRSSMKTTLNCVAHAVQWLLNYPAMAIWICQANLDKAQDIVKEVADHFRYNPALRQLFPEYCPLKPDTFGTINEFELPNRKQALQFERVKTRREPSVRAGTLEAGSAGLHFDLIKFSDIVETKNTLTSEQMEKTVRLFDTSEYLLVSVSESWVDVEGTRYHGGDLYGKIIDRWEQNEHKTRDVWEVFVRGVWKRDVKDPKYTPDELHAPYALDKDGKPYSWWESRYPTEKIRRDYEQKPYEVACQLLNSPSDGNKDKPFDTEIRKKNTITRDQFNRVAIAHHITTVDCASTVSAKADYTVITTCAYSSTGRVYVHDIQYGHFSPDEIIDRIFTVQRKFKPMLVRMESAGFELGLQAGIARKRDTQRYDGTLNPVYPNIQLVKRDTQTSKVERILFSLQPWYKNRQIYFVADIPCLEQLDRELDQFPRCLHDDILDTLADQFQNMTYAGHLVVPERTLEMPPIEKIPDWELKTHQVYENRAQQMEADPFQTGWGSTPDTLVDGNTFGY